LYSRKVLKKHWPHVKQYEDIKGLNYERLKADGLFPIDIITGGYPCQPFSVAGRKKGEEDPRHLWPEMFRLIKELRPSWVIGENVSGHIKLGLDTVLENLESEDYSARTFSISASSVGAKHKRERVWIVANTGRILRGEQSEQDQRGVGRGPSKTKKWSHNTDQTSGSSERAKTVANSGSSRSETRLSKKGHREEGNTEKLVNNSDRYRGWKREDNWAIEPNVGRVADGISNRVDRLKCLGNSLVPQIPYHIGTIILEVMNGKTN
jgi:DNA (cytosine-5)-methyltransferase 1